MSRRRGRRFRGSLPARRTTGRFALRVGYNRIGHDAGLQAHLFAESTRTFRQRIFIGFSKMLSGEAPFFAKLRPHLDVEARSGYDGRGGTRSYRSICLMEDVRETNGAQFLRPVEPVGRAEIEDLIADLATMHGKFWGSPIVREKGLRDQVAIVSWLDGLQSFRGRCHVRVKRAASVTVAPPPVEHGLWRNTGPRCVERDCRFPWRLGARASRRRRWLLACVPGVRSRRPAEEEATVSGAKVLGNVCASGKAPEEIADVVFIDAR